MVRIDDRSKGSSIGIVPNVGVLGPYQLISGDAFAGTCHAGKAEIGGIGEDCSQHCAVVRACLSCSQVRECSKEAGLAGDLVQQLGDPYTRHHTFDLADESFRAGGSRGL